MLLALAEAADDEGRVTASAQQLAPRARIAIRRAQDVLGELEEQRELEVVARGGGRGRSNTYRLSNYAQIAAFSALNIAKNAQFEASNTATVAEFHPGKTAGIAANPAETPQGLRSFPAPPGPPLIGNLQIEVPLSPTQEETPLPTSIKESPPPVRMLNEPAQAVAAVCRMFVDAGMDPPVPSTINRWFGRYKSPPHQGDLAGFVALMEDTVPRAAKARDSHAYIVSVISSPPRRSKGRLPQTLAAGGDAARSRQAHALGARSRARAGGGT
jgi:hypothetical protein